MQIEETKNASSICLFTETNRQVASTHPFRRSLMNHCITKYRDVLDILDINHARLLQASPERREAILETAIHNSIDNYELAAQPTKINNRQSLIRSLDMMQEAFTEAGYIELSPQSSPN